MRDRILESQHLGLGLAAAAAAAAAATTTYLLLACSSSSHATPTTPTPRPALDPRKTARSPKWTVLPALSASASASARDALPYPPDALPGARDVATAYGNLRVYEFGPEDAPERVLLLHGIGTPCLALGGVAAEFVAKGWRVMTFGES
ncbi:hypothetical protein LZ31DRAFT_345386 [Colletotrichum somersetense]|nr:hypothetical protein LZ31DRAFT_345386 [Colletotrichum somersetense]